MKSLLEYIKQNHNILDCPKCKRNLYVLVQSVCLGDQIKSSQFEPVNFDVPKPISNTEMRCPFCNTILSYDLARSK